MLTIEEKRLRQREADKQYALNHPDKLKAKHKRRYEENPEREKARNKSYYMLNREAQRVRHRDTKHKLPKGWFDAKVASQNNQCAICGDEFTDTPHIDHSHAHCPPSKSCNICRRDLLCTDCNLGLGRFKDSIKCLSSAIQYLRKHSVISIELAP